MTGKAYIKSLRTPTDNVPLNLLVSSFFMGTLCGADVLDGKVAVITETRKKHYRR